MSQQGMDLRTSMRVVRRYKVLVSIFVGLGLVGGCAYVVFNPPKVTSEAVIVVPGATASAMTTDVVI
ncbi:MAG TPA: Wzz/FepE/Etk N-terminal domain-containing protein, partial [Trebonia sp.]